MGIGNFPNAPCVMQHMAMRFPQQDLNDGPIIMLHFILRIKFPVHYLPAGIIVIFLEYLLILITYIHVPDNRYANYTIMRLFIYFFLLYVLDVCVLCIIH